MEVIEYFISAWLRPGCGRGMNALPTSLRWRHGRTGLSRVSGPPPTRGRTRTQVAELTRRLDDAVRAGKRQAAPFHKGPPKPDPKTPGRKSGDTHGTHGHRPTPSPEQIGEC